MLSPVRVTSCVAALSIVLLAGCDSAHRAPPGASGPAVAADTASGTPAGSASAAPIYTGAGNQAGTVQVSGSHCGEGWSTGKAGHEFVFVHNTDINPGEAYVTDAATGAILADVDPIGTGTTQQFTVDLAAGSYRFVCAIEDSDVVRGPVFTVSGVTGLHSPAVRPVSEADMLGPTRNYQHYVEGELGGLISDTRKLVADIRADDLGAAKTAWLAAHLDYERLGAAYGAFGAADGTINGLPNGLAGGVHDADFTGFHRVEYELWHSTPAAELDTQATTLLDAVNSLRTSFPTARIDTYEVAIRVHEITENALQFELTGETDFGSHSNLATVDANLAGTRTVLDMLRGLLVPRYTRLPETTAQLTDAQHDVAAQQHGGGWTALSALSRAERERINSDVAQLTELLAPIADICEPRRTS